MSSCDNSNIKKNYIVTGVEQDILSACTGFYTNNIYACSGNTINFNANIDNCGFTINTSFIGGCSPITVTDRMILLDGLTFNNITNDNSLDRVLVINTGGTVEYRDVSSLFTGSTTFVTGTTFSSNQAILSRNDGFDVLKISGGTNVTLSNPNTNEIVFDVIIPPDTNTFVSGFTYDNSNNLTIRRNDDVNLSTNIGTMSGLTINGDLLVTGTTNISGLTSINNSLDVYNGTIGLRDNDYFLQGTSTGGTNVQLIGVYSNDEILIGNQGYTNRIMDDTIVDGQLSVLSGLTVNGPLSACTGIYTSNIYGCSPITINDTAIFQQGIDVLTGDTILKQTSATTITLTNLPNLNNSATEILARNSSTGLVEYRDVNTITPDTNTFVTGFTYDNVNTFTISRNDNVDLTSTISVLSGITYYGDGSNLSGITTTDTFVTGGTFDNNTDTITFTNNSGGTFNVTGITDTFVIAGTYTDSTDTISLLRNDGNFVNITGVTDNFVSGGTYNIGTNEINFVGNSSETTFDVDLSSLISSVSGDTFVVSGNADVASSQLTFTYNTGGTFTVTNSAALFSDNDINVTGGTYNPSNGCVTFTTNSGTTFDVCGFLTGITDTYVTGGTYNESTDTITFTNTSGGTFNVTGITDTFVTGSSVTSNVLEITRNDSQKVLQLSGGTNITLTDNGSNSITIDTIVSGGGASVSLPWKFSSNTTEADPSSKFFRLNNSVLSAVTEIYVSDFTNNNIDSSFILSALEVGDNIYIQQNDDASKVVLFSVSAATIDNTGWFTIPVEYETGGDLFGNNKECGWVLFSLGAQNNTASNVGIGQGVFKQKVGNDFEFHSLSGGTNTTINLSGDTIVIDSEDTYVIAGTYIDNTDTISLLRNDGNFVNITGVTDTFTTGSTYDNGTALATFTRNDGNSYTLDLSTIDVNDTFSTGGTVTQSSSNNDNNQTIQIVGNDGFNSYNITGVTDTFTTGGTYDNGTALITFDKNDGTSYNVDLSTLDLNDTFITGFTYNDANTFTLNRNDGVDISTSINIVTGLTVNGDIEMGNSSTRQIYSTGVSEISSIEFTTSGTSVQMRWDGSGDSTVFTVNNTDFATLSSNKTAFGGLTYGSDYSPYYTDRSLIDLGYFNSNNRYVTGGTYDNGTALISYSGANGFPSFSVDMSSLDLNDTYVTGGTLTQPTDNTNSGLINLLYSQDVSPSTYSIPYTDTFITGFTYNNNNTFTIVENNGDTYSVTFNEVSGLTVNGDLNVTGNTYLVDVSGTSLFTDYIDFRNIGASLPTDQQGRIYWDDDNGTLSLGMYGGQVVQQIGLEKYYYIKNQSGATISNGRVVRAAGTLGASGRILGEYMIADGTIPPKFTLGIATEDIINGDDGYVTEFGLVRGINTTGTPYGEVWNDGDILWVSPTIPGGLTKVEPQAPNLKIEIAIVIYANANGSIFVRPNRYPYLYDIQQVNYSAGTENNLDILFWNNSNKTWDKTNTPSFSGLTIYGDTTQIGNFNITGNTLQNGNTTTNGNVDIITTGGTGCTLSVTGKTCLDGDLEVTGNVFVVGNLDYDGNLIVTGSTIISSGLTVFSGVSADFITITTTPTENNDLIQILGRNSSTGDVEYRDVKTIGNNITTVTGTTYSATTTDDVIGIDSSTNTVTLYLPDSVSSGRLRYDIKDIGVNSFNNPITIQAAGSDTIITTSVVSSFELSADGGAVILVNTGTGQWWQM